MLADRIAANKPPVGLRCPSGGCAFCGIPAVPMPAAQVLRLGGPLAAEQQVWRRITTLPTSLGGRGPNLVRGHLCPLCSEALDDVGAIGQPARARALLAYLDRTAPAKERPLRNRLADDFPPSLPAWAASARKPNATPWSHLRGLLDAL